MSAPTSPVTPPATAVTCPLCGAVAGSPAAGRCPGCGADLTDPAFERILELDRRWRSLATERHGLVARLAATRPLPPPPPPMPEPAPSREPELSSEPAPSPDRAPPPSLGVPALLALAGVALLTTAAVVFSVVTWTTLPPGGQAAILLTVTMLAAVIAIVVQRRGLPTAAAALGVLTMAFVAVDVIGLDRSGLVPLDAFTIPVGALAAATAGWGLGRVRLRWVSTAGATAAVLAAGTGTIAVAETFVLPAARVALVGTVLALLAVASIPAWPTTVARRVAAVGGTGWLTVSGLIGAWSLAESDGALAPGLAVVAIPLALLIIGARWSENTLAPATLLATFGAVAAAVHLGVSGSQVPVVAAVALATAAWVSTRLGAPWRWPVRVGAVPVAVMVLAVVLETAGDATARLAAVVGGGTAEPVDPWAATTVAIAGIALLTVQRLRSAAGWLALPVLLVASAAVPLPVAWPSLLVGAAAVAGARGRLRWDPLIVLVLAVVAVGWSAGSSVTVAIAAGTTAALSAWMTVGTELVRRRVALGLALVAGGLAVGAATDAMAVTADVALGAGLTAVVLGSVAAVRFGPDTPPIVGPTVMAIATVVAPTLASSMRVSGLLLLVAATGWLLLALVGPPHPARWVAAVVASVGSIVLLADIGVEVVELYTVVPVLALGAAGSWWLIEDRAVRTLAALSPALIVALVPSLVVLARDPQVLGRTLGLTAVAGVLAFAGVRGLWLAPTLAGAGAAFGIAVTQLTIVVEVVPRWATFAVVGILLVWLAATYEAQQARARRLGHYLRALR